MSKYLRASFFRVLSMIAVTSCLARSVSLPVKGQGCYRAGSLSDASANFVAAQTISSLLASGGRSWTDYSFVTV